MANTIKIKRRPSGQTAGKPSSLYNGELAFNESDNILYYGFGSGIGGVASTIEQIGGSGYFAHRGGTNASGLWPIGVTGNAGTVTNGVYTTGNQTINGTKTFADSGLFDGVFKAAYVGSNYNVIFSPSQIWIGQGDLDVKFAGNTYYDPNGEFDASKEVANKAYITTTLSGINLIAGSGLVGGGTLSASRTFHIGSGDGITVSDDSISVDSTVVRSTSVNVSGYVPVWSSTSSKTLNVGYQVSDNLNTNNSASFLPRADAVKSYVDNAINSGISVNDAMIFQGVIDCSTNPNYPAAERGWTYKVSVAGKIGGSSGPVVEVNDTLICTTDGTPSGNHATVGSNWTILQTNIADASILVSGPASATSGNIAIFDGTTGKIIKDGGFLASDIVLTTGNQTISGSKTFSSQILANTGISIGDLGNYLTGTGLVINWGDGGGILTSFVNAASPSNNSINLNANTTFNNVAGNGALPFIISPTGYAGSGAVTQGFWRGSTVEVNKGGTGQTSYTNGQLLIGNSTDNTLTKATLTQASGIVITNGAGSIIISHEDTSTLNGAQGGNGIASIGLDGYGHVTGVTTATYLTAGTVCAAIVDCTLDGGSF